MSKIYIHITTKDDNSFEVTTHQEAETLLRHLIKAGISIKYVMSNASWIAEDLTEFLNYYKSAVKQGVHND